MDEEEDPDRRLPKKVTVILLTWGLVASGVLSFVVVRDAMNAQVNIWDAESQFLLNLSHTFFNDGSMIAEALETENLWLLVLVEGDLGALANNLRLMKHPESPTLPTLGISELTLIEVLLAISVVRSRIEQDPSLLNPPGGGESEEAQYLLQVADDLLAVSDLLSGVGPNGIDPLETIGREIVVTIKTLMDNLYEISDPFH